MCHYLKLPYKRNERSIYLSNIFKGYKISLSQITKKYILVCNLFAEILEREINYTRNFAKDSTALFGKK